MLTADDRAVLAYLLEDPDAWIAHTLATVGPDAVVMKCRRAAHVAAYRAAKGAQDYAPRGALPSDRVCASVAQALAAIEQAKRDAREAQSAQRDRIDKLFA